MTRKLVGMLSRSADHDGWIDWYVYTGLPGDSTRAHVFAGPEATDFVNRVKAAGYITADAYWHCVESKHRDEVPDYVTNWWHPEYN